MSKKTILLSVFVAAVALTSIAIVGTSKQSDEKKASESQARADEFVIAQDRWVPPQSPSELDIQAVESNIVALEPVDDSRRDASLNLTVFDKPSPKRPSLKGFGHQLDPAQVEAFQNQKGSKPAEPQTPAFLGPTPGLRSSFDSTIFDDNITTTGGSIFIPPDSHAAAGNKHVVNVVNTTIRFHLKDGTLQFQDSLANFFAALGPLTNTFDPKVLYDQYARRFVVITLEQTDVLLGAPSDTSRIFVAVSDDDDPNGTWYTTAINAVTVIGGVPHWVDYPGLAVDDTGVYITGNMFSFFSFGGTSGGNRMWSIAKEIGTGFYSGGPVSGTVINPVPAGGFGLTQQPAHAYGKKPFDGTFLIGFSGLSNGTDEFFQIIRVENPLTAPALDLQFLNFGNVDDLAAPLPLAPQLGTPVLVDTNDRRTLDAVWRSDNLYVTTMVNPAAGLPDAGEVTSLWAQVDTSTLATLALADLGMIGGEDIAPQTFTTFPSIAVNKNDDVAVGFSALAATIHPSSYFASRLCTDPPGKLSKSYLLRAGLDFYIRTFGNTNRWGDYSSVAVDPIDNCFWVYNQHSLTRGLPSPPGAEDGRWGTAYGQTCPCVKSSRIPQNRWKLIAIPCEARGATVANTFGDDMSGVYGTDWVVYGWVVSSQSYTLLAPNSRLSSNQAYWIRTRLANQYVTVGDISNSKFGMKLAVNPGRLTFNMVGHPYPITACWADVLVIDGNSLLTLDQADPLIGGVRACDMVPPDPSCVMSRVAYTWNGSSYDAIDGITPGMQGTLQPFEGMFVRAYKPGIGLRFSTVSNNACGGPSAGLIESNMHNQNQAMQTGWYVRVIAQSGDLIDDGAVFGQLPDSIDGFDKHDLPELPPFAEPNLTVGFLTGFGNSVSRLFNTDYRALDGLNGKDAWRFQVDGSEKGSQVDLTLNGPAWLLDNGVLVDESNGTRHPANGTYSFRQNGQPRSFTFYPNSK